MEYLPQYRRELNGRDHVENVRLSAIDWWYCWWEEIAENGAMDVSNEATCNEGAKWLKAGNVVMMMTMMSKDYKLSYLKIKRGEKREWCSEIITTKNQELKNQRNDILLYF